MLKQVNEAALQGNLALRDFLARAILTEHRVGGVRCVALGYGTGWAGYGVEVPESHREIKCLVRVTFPNIEDGFTLSQMIKRARELHGDVLDEEARERQERNLRLEQEHFERQRKFDVFLENLHRDLGPEWKIRTNADPCAYKVYYEKRFSHIVFVPMLEDWVRRELEVRKDREPLIDRVLEINRQLHAVGEAPIKGAPWRPSMPSDFEKRYQREHSRQAGGWPPDSEGAIKISHALVIGESPPMPWGAEALERCEAHLATCMARYKAAYDKDYRMFQELKAAFGRLERPRIRVFVSKQYRVGFLSVELNGTRCTFEVPRVCHEVTTWLATLGISLELAQAA